MDVYKADFITKTWEGVAHFRKPIIAAVAGYALGGGCELSDDVRHDYCRR
jgi:enoyl-CoA hydratase